MSATVAVIGGGVAGLSAAYRLKELGIDSVVFEKEGFVGGRMSSETVDGFTIDKAAYTWPEYHVNLTAFLSKVGMAQALFRTPGTSSFFTRGEEHAVKIGSPKDFLTYRLLSLKSKKDMVKLYMYVQSLGKALDLANPTEKTFALESELASDYILGNYGKEILEHIAWPIFCEIFLGAPEQNSKVPFLATLKNLLWFKIFNLNGGMGALPQAMAAALQVRTEAPVESVTKDAGRGGFVVEIGGPAAEPMVFDAVIFAVPSPLLPHVFPALDADLSVLLRQVEYARSVVIALALDGERDNTSFINNLSRDEHPVVGTLVFDRHKGPGRVPAGKELVTAVLTQGASEALFDSADEDVTSATVQEVDSLFPGLSDRALFSRVYRWRFGAMQFPLGALRRLSSARELIDRLDPRIALAGDGYHKTSLEMAFNTGVRAAERIGRSLIR